MSILKSTNSGKHMLLTEEYLLDHGWYHPWMFGFEGATNVNYNTLVRAFNKHGELEIKRENGHVFFYCVEYYKIDGFNDEIYRYRYEYRPKTVRDLEMMISFWDENKSNRKRDKRATLYHEEFVHAEVVRE